MILRDEVQLSKVQVLLELLKNDLLLGEGLLKAPKLLPIIFTNEDHLCVILHDNDPAQR